MHQQTEEFRRKFRRFRGTGKDYAKLLRVSEGTVSRCVNGERVTERTYLRMQKAMPLIDLHMAIRNLNGMATKAELQQLWTIYYAIVERERKPRYPLFRR